MKQQGLAEEVLRDRIQALSKRGWRPWLSLPSQVEGVPSCRLHPGASLSQMRTANWKPPGSCSPNTSTSLGRQVVNETTTQLGKAKGVEKASWPPSATVLEGSEGGASFG